MEHGPGRPLRARHLLRLLAPLAALALAAAACSSTPRPAAAAPTTTQTTAAHHTTAVAATTSTADCPDGRLGFHQTMSGRIQACIRVGALAAGTYHVRIDGGVLSTVPADLKGSAAGPTVTSLRLSPSSGAPGTRITVTGTLAEPTPKPSTHVDLCFDGCRKGLDYSGATATWTGDQTFQAHLVVPDGPWVERDPTRVVVPTTASFPVGVRCVSQVDEEGCGLRAALAHAMFHLEVHGSPVCSGTSECARLRATPDAVEPGDVVRVEGFAPLTSVIGSDHPFVSGAHVAPGAGSGPEVRFTTRSKFGTSNVFPYFGHATFRVTAPPSFASLSPTTPTGPAVEDGISPIAATDHRLAWCEPGAVDVSDHGDAHVSSTIPTTEAVAELTKAGLVPYPSVSHERAACVGVELVPGHPHSALVAFSVNPHQSAPPLALVAMATHDAGASWSPVPVPNGATETTFAGFRTVGSELVSTYRPKALSADGRPVVPLVEASTDGGRTWHQIVLACPSSGPCVTFGPYVPGNCAMNGSTQELLLGSSGGTSWTRPDWPTGVQACDPAELVPTGAHSMLLADSGSPYLLLRTTNGGRSWSAIGLPSLPGRSGSAQAFGPGQGGLIVLGDGSLLAWTTHDGAPPSTSWQLLEPHASSWCSVTSVLGHVGGVDAAPETETGRLFWTTMPASNQAANQGIEVPHAVPLTSVHC